MRREWEWAWPAILAVIGDVKVKNLDTAKWTSFLLSRPWSGRSRAIVQQAYRTCLRYAHEIGAVEAVHTFRPIAGSNARTLEPGEALTPEEVPRVLPTLLVHGCRKSFQLFNRELNPNGHLLGHTPHHHRVRRGIG